MNFYSVYADPAVYHSNSADGYVVIATGKIGVVQLLVTNLTASVRYAQVFDGYASPTAGDVPVMELALAANSQAQVNLLAAHWLPLVNGFAMASSTTAATYTAGGASDLFITAFYFAR